jgi:hypothetical protein
VNLFDAVICNQYYELVKTSRDGSKALFNGNLLNSACILLLLLTLFNLTVLNGAASKNFFEELRHAVRRKKWQRPWRIISNTVVRDYLLFCKEHRWHEKPVSATN